MTFADEPDDEDAQAEGVDLAHSHAEGVTSDFPEDRGPGKAEYTEIVKVYNARDLSEAMLVKGILESFQIPCSVEDDPSLDMATLSGSHLDGVDVTVPSRFVNKARDVLCERGVICPVDDERLRALSARLAEAQGSDQGRAALVRDLDKEPMRDLRHRVLEALAALPGGFETALGMLELSSASERESPPLVTDIPILCERGRFGAAARARAAGELSRLAAAPDAKLRRRAARALGKLRDPGANAALVQLLEDEDETVRDEAVEALYVISRGDDFGFRADAPEAERRESVARWRTWLGR